MTIASHRRLVLIAATAALSGGLALSSVSPSAAAPARTAEASAVVSSAGTQGTAPACVVRDVIKHHKTVTVKNHCGQTMHLKVVIDRGPDSRCLTYQPREQWTWKWQIGSYGKVVTC